jgi:hypothetical protein
VHVGCLVDFKPRAVVVSDFAHAENKKHFKKEKKMKKDKKTKTKTKMLDIRQRLQTGWHSTRGWTKLATCGTSAQSTAF